jgi:hypothetical protein
MIYFPYTFNGICGWKYSGMEETHLKMCLVVPQTVKFLMQIGFINYPFTRILDRLLGPCFKTGPKGIPNLTAVDQKHIKSHCEMSDAETSIIWSLKSIRQSLQNTIRFPGDTHNRKRLCHSIRETSHWPIDDPMYTGVYQFLMDHGVLLREKCTLHF